MGFDLEDERNFSGLYAQMEWDPAPRWRFQVGARLNRTVEDREAGEAELDGGGGGEEEEEEGSDSRTTTRGSGTLGVSWLAWGDAASGLWLFADYRNSYKPAALDFGPEAEARHPAAGDRQQLRGRRQEPALRRPLRLGAHRLPDGLREPRRRRTIGRRACRSSSTPARSASRGSSSRPGGGSCSDLWLQGSYAWHDAKFRDYVQDFDGVLTQLGGKRLRDVGAGAWPRPG